MSDNQPIKKIALPADALSPYLAEVSGIPVLNAEDEKALFLLVASGDMNAKNKAIQHNLRLVLKIARRYLNRGLCFSDLVAEGNLGLIRACEKFDPTMGFRFSTYACPWIAQSIERALQNGASLIRVPVHVTRQLNMLKRTQNELNQVELKETSLDNAAEFLGDSFSNAMVSAHNSQQIISLTPHDEDDGPSLIDSLMPLMMEQVNEVETEVELSQLVKKLSTAIEQLTESQQLIIRGRYGLHGQEPRTLEEIGEDLGLTREGVRQQQIRAERDLLGLLR